MRRDGATGSNALVCARIGRAPDVPQGGDLAVARGHPNASSYSYTARGTAMSNTRHAVCKLILVAFATAVVTSAWTISQAAKRPVDPGVRGGPPSAGGPLPGLTADELAFFHDGRTRFVTTHSVTGGPNSGLGPRFNADSCVLCHSEPDVGGTSPDANPLVVTATIKGARNVVPWFITLRGPIREARFKRNPDGSDDGSVHDAFVITGRSDAAGCNIAQPDFLPAGNALTGQGGNTDISFRIPTPMFGSGLIEAIPDSAILANMAADAQRKKPLGIFGHPNAHLSGTVNRSANDGTITRFGWKAQNKSLLMFAGEAANVEMGISNQLFPQKVDETPGCVLNPTPDDTVRLTTAVPPDPTQNTATLSDIEAFADFMRMLAPPTPAPDTPSTQRGRDTFMKVGCAFCHTPSFTTGMAIASGSSTSPSAALSNKPVNLWSDLLVHRMGRALADGITQGSAGPDEFRTAPLWGVGQRVFFLHDGRTTDLIQAIEAHRGRDSEANRVIDRYDRLRAQQQQDIINFMRAL
jgi:CxxC motif-containing protein (DUF1111 family)